MFVHCSEFREQHFIIIIYYYIYITWTRPIVMIFSTLCTRSGHSGFRCLVIWCTAGQLFLKFPYHSFSLSPFFHTLSPPLLDLNGQTHKQQSELMSDLMT